MSTGKRYNNANLNSLFERPSEKPSGSGATSGVMRSGMLILQGHRSQRTRFGSGPAGGKLAIPKPVNLPSLRKEHSGNDPNTQLVPPSGGGGGGWHKPPEEHHASGGPEASEGPYRPGGGAWHTGGGAGAPPAPARPPPRPVPRSKTQVLGEEEYPTLEAASHLKQPVKAKKGDRPSQGAGMELRKTQSENLEWSEDDRRGYQQTAQRAQRPGWFEDERYAPTESYGGYSWDNDYRMSEYHGRSQSHPQDSGPVYGPGPGMYPPPHRMGPPSPYPAGTAMPLYHSPHMQGPYPGPPPYSQGMPYPDYRPDHDYRGSMYMDASLFPPPPPPPPPPGGRRVEGPEGATGHGEVTVARDVEREEYEAELRRRVQEMEAKRMMEAEPAAGPQHQAGDGNVRLVKHLEEADSKQQRTQETCNTAVVVPSDGMTGDRTTAPQAHERSGDDRAEMQRAAEAAKQAATAAMSDIPEEGQHMGQLAIRHDGPTEDRNMDWEAQVEDEEKAAAAARERARHDLSMRMRYQTPVLLKQPSHANAARDAQVRKVPEGDFASPSRPNAAWDAQGQKTPEGSSVSSSRPQPPPPPHLRTKPVGSQVPQGVQGRPGPPPQQAHPNAQGQPRGAVRQHSDGVPEPPRPLGANQALGGGPSEASARGPWGQRPPCSVQEQMDLNSRPSWKDGKATAHGQSKGQVLERHRSADDAESSRSRREGREAGHGRGGRSREGRNGDRSNGDVSLRLEGDKHDQPSQSKRRDERLPDHGSRPRRRESADRHDREPGPGRQETVRQHDRDSRPARQENESRHSHESRSRRRDEAPLDQGRRLKRQENQGARDQGTWTKRQEVRDEHDQETQRLSQDVNMRGQGQRSKRPEVKGAQVQDRPKRHDSESRQDRESRPKRQEGENRQGQEARPRRQDHERLHSQESHPQRPDEEDAQNRGGRSRSSRGKKGLRVPSEGGEGGKEERGRGQRPVSAEAGARPMSQHASQQGPQVGRSSSSAGGDSGGRRIRGRGGEGPRGDKEMANDGAEAGQKVRPHVLEQHNSHVEGANQKDSAEGGRGRWPRTQRKKPEHEQGDRGGCMESGDGREAGHVAGHGQEGALQGQQTVARARDTSEQRKKRRSKTTASGSRTVAGIQEQSASTSQRTPPLTTDVAKHAQKGCEDGKGHRSGAMEGSLKDSAPQTSSSSGFQNAPAANTVAKAPPCDPPSSITMPPRPSMDLASVAGGLEAQHANEPPIQFGQFGGAMSGMLYGIAGPFSAPPGQFGQDVTPGIVKPAQGTPPGRPAAPKIVASGMEMATTGEGVQCLPQELLAETTIGSGEVVGEGQSMRSDRQKGRMPVDATSTVLPDTLFQGEADTASSGPTTSGNGGFGANQRGQGRGRGRGRRGAHKRKPSRGSGRGSGPDGGAGEDSQGGRGRVREEERGRGRGASQGHGRGMVSRGRGGRGGRGRGGGGDGDGGGREQPATGERNAEKSRQEWVPKGR
eukprot:evm.model.scf_122.15 EVM.evm.TU.scf_122.15   scf_122:116426-122982(+)